MCHINRRCSANTSDAEQVSLQCSANGVRRSVVGAQSNWQGVPCSWSTTVKPTSADVSAGDQQLTNN